MSKAIHAEYKFSSVEVASVYRLSRLISQNVMDLLYIDDLKINAYSQSKLKVVTSDARMAMKDIGLAWNAQKCATAHVKRGKLETSDESSIREADVIQSLKERSQYKFLGVLENVNHEDSLVLRMQRMCTWRDYQ